MGPPDPNSAAPEPSPSDPAEEVVPASPWSKAGVEDLGVLGGGWASRRPPGLGDRGDAGRQRRSGRETSQFHGYGNHGYPDHARGAAGGGADDRDKGQRTCGWVDGPAPGPGRRGGGRFGATGRPGRRGRAGRRRLGRRRGDLGHDAAVRGLASPRHGGHAPLPGDARALLVADRRRRRPGTRAGSPRSGRPAPWRAGRWGRCWRLSSTSWWAPWPSPSPARVSRSRRRGRRRLLARLLVATFTAVAAALVLSRRDPTAEAGAPAVT